MTEGPQSSGVTPSWGPEDPRPYALMWVKWFGWVEEKTYNGNMQGGLNTTGP